MADIIGGTYVVGDIHGHLDEWLELKNRIERIDSEAKFILLGDIVDRGPKTIEMVQWAMENISKDGKYQMIMGNHEYMKIMWLHLCKDYLKWNNKESIYLSDLDNLSYYNEQYSFDSLYLGKGHGFSEICGIINWFSKLDYYKYLELNGKKFILAHANIPYSIVSNNGKLKTEFNSHEKEYIVWSRDINGFDILPDTMLIHGHTPTIMHEAFPYYVDITDDILGKAFYSENRVNIDCGLAYKSYNDKANLLALRLDDMKEFYLYE